MGFRPRRLTRRAFISAAAWPLLAEDPKGKGATFPTDWRRYNDPSTELMVFRLTDPAWSSRLPAPWQRAAARRGNFLLFASDRTGSPQAFRMDLKTGATRQLSAAEALDPASLALDAEERRFLYFDGPVLKMVDLGNLREREIYRLPQGWDRQTGFSVSEDGRSAALVERGGGRSRLRFLPLGRGDARTLVENDGEIALPLMRPGRRQDILYRRGGEVWAIGPDGRQDRKLPLAGGTTGPARWSPDGATLLYLNFPADKTQLNTIREYSPDGDEDKLVARTSQFVSFAFNRNTSVFVGASRNVASPTLLLLLRVTRREFTLCEHASSDAASVTLHFSPDSQTVYFESDRHGKPAIYFMRVEKIVEET